MYMSGQEIQGNRTLEQNLNEYKKFHDYRILNPHDGEKVKKGLRVVRKFTKDKDFKAGDLGSINDVNENGEVFIKWDKHDNKSESFHTDKFNQYKLLLFDNAQADVEHEDFTCDGCRQDPLYGIRWKCLTCADYDLCTKCYIIDKHIVDHIFKRIVSPNSKG
ncbi:MIB [Mytilus edulis]|uniref:MIB n=1 Tax=Mytilus edulis TaxID=6550 RepID=A0A8S3VHY4_MYTED|nr:MIB [Mytilus edulis]